jgi:hypothetical protein
VSKDRKDIYLSDGLRRALAGMPGTLSTNVNLIADRYMGLVVRERPVNLPEEHASIYKKVLAEIRGRAEAREILTFPELVADWLIRNPIRDHVIVYEFVKNMNYAQRLSLIDRLERKP